MGSVMSLTCSKRKATTQDVDSSSNGSSKREKICSSSTNDNYEYCSLNSDEFSWKHPWSFCANVAAALGFFTRFTQLRLQQDDKVTESSSLSPPTPLVQNSKYPVFLSFHGADVRKTILSHILASFRRKGVYPFIDDEIDRGKSIGPELIEAIRGSKIAIVLLSKNYASSSWCLDELTEIINCREVLGQIVMTVFYEVDPSDIKKQAGDFGKAFRKTCKGKPKECINKWRKALEVVATIAGEHSPTWINEAAMIEKIVTDVSNKLTVSMPSRDFDDFVGMGAHIERMASLLCLDLDEVRMIGIWGPPGIGKSTIARVSFNQFFSRFQNGAIMVNIKESYPRPCLDEYPVQLQLQNQMLSQIINQKDIKISHLGVAPELLKDKKVLLVIDEVDRLGQLHALAKKLEWFGHGSRIIITSEDRSLFKAHGINHIYKVKFPSDDEAFQIFCTYAFEQKHPDDGFYELAVEISYLAGKLPLGLKILGSALRGKSKQEWEMILPRLETSLDGEIKSVIKFSYDALCDEDKYLFLYIACIFNYEESHKVEELLADKFSNVRQGLYILAEKSLISIDEYGRIEMHTLLQQFGRETSRNQYVHNGLAKRQLLVDERDISEVLNDDTTDSNRFIAINVFDKTQKKLDIGINDKSIKRISDLQFVRLNGPSVNQSILQSLIFHSPKIRSLTWSFISGNICLPSTFNTEFLVELHLPHSNLQKLWEGNKELKNLKWINLSYSRRLKELPDLSTATKLEELLLDGCSSLVEVPGLSTATKLTKLQLQLCSSLVKLPSYFGNIKELDLLDCQCLVELPSAIGTAINLQSLNLENCSSLVKIPFSIGNLQKLEELRMNGCSKIESFPTNINLKSLRSLELRDCSQLKTFPEISTNIKTLDLAGTAINEIPYSIGNLQKLVKLRMDGCSKLEAFPTNINLKSLGCLSLQDCWQLKTFPEISTNINHLRLIGTAIIDIPLTIKLWPRLNILLLKDCNNLVSLPQFPDSLCHLDASNCKSLERLDCSFNNPDIKLVFENCFKLNQEARDLIIKTSCASAVLPGREVPACFNYCQVTDGDYFTTKLNEWPRPAYLRFKACFMIKVDDEAETRSGENLGMMIMTRPNPHKIPFTLSSTNIPECLDEHMYILEVGFIVGAEVDPSTELGFKFIMEDDSNWKMGECRLMQI